MCRNSNNMGISTTVIFNWDTYIFQEDSNNWGGSNFTNKHKQRSALQGRSSVEHGPFPLRQPWDKVQTGREHQKSMWLGTGHRQGNVTCQTHFWKSCLRLSQLSRPEEQAALLQTAQDGTWAHSGFPNLFFGLAKVCPLKQEPLFPSFLQGPSLFRKRWETGQVSAGLNLFPSASTSWSRSGEGT